MKKKISWLSFMAVFFILFSCRNEQEALNESSANRKRDVISFSVFQKETQIQKVGQVISPLSTAHKNNQNDDPLSGFLIDTENINRIKANADISTYAFRIYSLFGNPQDVYNMVYRKRNDGTLHYSIISIIGNTPYVLYDSEAASVAQKYAHKNTDAQTVIDEDCEASYSVSVWHCKNGHSWETCDKCPECLETLTVCVGSGGGDNSGGFGNPSDGNPSDPPPPLDPFSEGGSAAYLTDPSGYVFDPNVPPSTDKEYVRALRARLFWEQIPGALYRQWASGNAGIYHNLIENYLNNYSTGDNSNNINFTNWAIDFLMQNPDTTWIQFESWFLTKSEGSDGLDINDLDYVLSTIQYQTKQMPTYSQFVSVFPKLPYPGYPGYYKQMPAKDVYNIVGGNLLSLYESYGGADEPTNPYRNACTVRFSLVMNLLGFYIPNNSLSRQGANINGIPAYYYLQAKTAGDFMQKTFGNPTHKLEGLNANNSTVVTNFLKGKTGIYVIVNNNSTIAGYTGHVDLIQNGHIPGGSNHENVPGGIKSIRIWEFTP